MTSDRSLARTAGVLYLVVAVFGSFAELYVRHPIIEPGNATATAANIRDAATLFRIGFASDLVQATFFLFTAFALYLLLRRFQEMAARAMVVFVAIAVAIMCLNLLNQYAALKIATGGSSPQADALAGLFAGMHADGYLIAQIFFGLWLLPLGYLALRSGWFPKALAWLLMVACAGYLIDTFATFLAPGVAAQIRGLVLVPAAVAELWMVGYLLIKGVRTDVPREPIAVAA